MDHEATNLWSIIKRLVRDCLNEILNGRLPVASCRIDETSSLVAVVVTNPISKAEGRAIFLTTFGR